MNEKITVLVVEPNKKPYAAEIENTLEAKQKLVGGDMQAVRLNRDPILAVCNDNGKLLGLELNRAIRNEDNKIVDVLVGTFFICGIGTEEFCSLTPDQIEKYKKQFYYPEMFIQTEKGLAVVATKPSIREELNQKVKEQGKKPKEPQAPKRDKPPEL